LTRQWLIPIFVILSVTALVVSSNQEKIRSLSTETNAQISQISDLENTLAKTTDALIVASEEANLLSDKLKIQNQELQDLEQRLAELEIQLSEVERPIFGDEQE
jgi:septal ring factor EnvC (AmiA/AmiB activator)